MQKIRLVTDWGVGCIVFCIMGPLCIIFDAFKDPKKPPQKEIWEKSGEGEE